MTDPIASLLGSWSLEINLALHIAAAHLGGGIRRGHRL